MKSERSRLVVSDSAYQAPPSTDFPDKSTGVGVPLPSPKDKVTGIQFLFFKVAYKSLFLF